MSAGRLGSVTPFEILDYVARTGDMDAVERRTATTSSRSTVRALTRSKGLRRQLFPDDEQFGVTARTPAEHTSG
jgi:hypothetical protein